MNIFYVYSYIRSRNSKNGIIGSPYYIGKGSNGRAFDKNHGIIPIPKDKNNIVFLETGLSENKAFEIEKFLIAYYGRKDLGTGILYNRTDGGEGTFGYKHSVVTKEKMSNSRIGECNSFFGKKHSEETKKKISDTGRGRVTSDETKKKLSNVGKGRPGKPLSDETKKKLSDALKGRPGKPLSDETKKKLSDVNKNRPIIECPYCGKTSNGNGAMKRWHFNNCINKE